MSRPKKRKGGRVTPKGTGAKQRPPKQRDPMLANPFGGSSGGPPTGLLDGRWSVDVDELDAELDDDGTDVLAMAGDALASGHPAELLALSSTLAEAIEAADRPDRLFDVPDDDELSWGTVVDEFSKSERPETTALLYALQPFAPDRWRKEIATALAERSTPNLPEWIASIGDLHVTGVRSRSHVLGDDDDVFIGARWPTGQEATLVVHVDHLSGGIVEDVILAPMGDDAFLSLFDSANGDTARISEVDLADGRARLADAVRRWEMTYPQASGQDWPSLRPLLLLLLSMLPEGGVDLDDARMEDDQRAGLVEAFLAAPQSKSVRDDPDTRMLVESIIWFGADYGVRDPLRWSEQRIEQLMLDWFPRKVLTDEDFLAKLPAVLSPFVTFCMERLGEREGLAPDLLATLTADALESIDDLAPEYLDLISGNSDPFEAGGDPVQALLDRLGATADDDMRAELAQLLASDDDED